ncbi:MAG: hypothetical protein LBQ92_05115, partial [Propionibacteriaceae bacterium]|nr:hypothetical protein [Propionibacteriaceae bacterium]
MKTVLLLLASAAAGAVGALGFAPFGVWPFTILSAAALSVVLWFANRLRNAAGFGYAYGLAFMGVGVNWMSAIFTDAMFALVAVTSLYFILLAILIKLAQKAPFWPLLAAGAWTACELGLNYFPFGGFGWMRLGYAMVDSPLAGAYPLVGVGIVGFFAALAGQLIGWFLLKVSVGRGVWT